MSVSLNPNTLKSVSVAIKKNHYILSFKNNTIDRLKDLHLFCQKQIKVSTPSYYQFKKDTPNFLKFNQYNSNSIVDGYFYQYNFFPWNRDSENAFSVLREQIDWLLMLSSYNYFEQTENSYNDNIALSANILYNENYFVRICYQYFPKNVGYLSIHRDPVGLHQICAPIVNLTCAKEKGLYLIDKDQKIDLQSILNYGHTIYFDSGKLHGVDHDLFTVTGTEHFLVSIHNYHNSSKFLKSSVR